MSDVLGDPRCSKPSPLKPKLKRLSDSHYDVQKAQKYFQSEDFKRLGPEAIGEGADRVGETVYVRDAHSGEYSEESAVNLENADVNSEDEEITSESDSDLSTASERSGHRSNIRRGRTGSYDFLNVDDVNDITSISIEIEQLADDFRTDEECSSISVTDSENESNEEENGDDEQINQDNNVIGDRSTYERHKLKSETDENERDEAEWQGDHLESDNHESGDISLRAVLDPLSSSEIRNRPKTIRERPSTLRGVSQASKTSKRDTAFNMEVDDSPLSPTISRDIIGGYSLNRGWVDRVNKSLAANSRRTSIPTSNEELIRSARNCKIMKRYSEKSQIKPARPSSTPERMRKTSSDNRHDRHYEQLIGSRNNEEESKENSRRIESDYETVYPTEKQPSMKVAYRSIRLSGNSGTKNNQEMSASNVETQDRRPRIPRKKVGLDLQTNKNNVTERQMSNSHTVSNNFGRDFRTSLAKDNWVSANVDSSDRSSQAMHSEQAVKAGGVNQLSTNVRRSSVDKNSVDDLCDGISPGTECMEFQECTDNSDKDYPPKFVDSQPHGLIRKPAVRRKGYAWTSRSLPKNSGSDFKKQDLLDGNSEEAGSSLDLAPSLLNIYDDIAKDTIHENGDDNDASTASATTKTQSLPARALASTTSTVHHRNGKLPSSSVPSDRPVSMMDADPVVSSPPRPTNIDNKKRPLSISSISSTSTSSLPRLRKKRANTDDVNNAGSGPICNQTVMGSLITNRGLLDGLALTSESRHSVDSGCVDGDRNGDKYLDNMSITSSETGSFKDEVDSSLCSVRDPSMIPSSPTERPLTLQLAHSSPKSNLLSPTPNPNHPSPLPRLKDTLPKSGSTKPTSLSKSSQSPKSTTPLGQRLISDANDSGVVSDRSSYFNPPSPSSRSAASDYSQKDSDSVGTPENSRRSLSSASRHEARKRFFSNYEEHISQSPPSPGPAAEFMQNSGSASESSERRNSLQPTDPSLSSSAVTTGKLHHRESPPTASTAERRRGSSSQFSPGSEKRSSEKPSRRSERHGPSSKYEGQPSASSSVQKSVFSRSSKKRDNLGAGDANSKTGPVYVSYVQRVVTEILESERTYIASLEDIIHGYLEPLVKILKSSEAEEDISCLFSNIRDIYKFNCTFLADLEMTGADPVKVAQCFVKHNKGFVIYTDYCTNYPRAVEVLTKFMQHPELSELCKERQTALGHGLPLGAYLLRPVQRILKYHLLLQNIVKNCEKEGKDAAILEQAFHHMTQMAYHINEMKRKHEHAVRIQEIQSQLEDYVGEDLTRLGDLVLESTFRVYGAKASRQVFLFERGLLISKKKEGGMLSCKTFIRCSNLMLVEVIPNEPLSFHVIPFNNPRAQYTLQARNMEQKRRWCQEIKRLILESFKGAIPDSVKSLVMELGKNHDDDYVTKEALDAVRKNQHTAPEYLEKRRVRRKSGTRMPDFSLLKPQRVRRAANKKENKPDIRLSPAGGRRAESRSPDSHRRIFSKQNAIKRRSQSHTTTTSLPTTPSSDPSYSDLFDQSKEDSEHAKSQPPTPGHYNPQTEVPSTESPTPPSHDKSYPKNSQNTAASEKADKILRGESFRLAMEHGLSGRVARRGRSSSEMHSSTKRQHEDVEILRNGSDDESSEEEEEHMDEAYDDSYNNGSSIMDDNTGIGETPESESSYCNHNLRRAADISSSSDMILEPTNEEQMKIESRSTSLPVLNKSNIDDEEEEQQPDEDNEKTLERQNERCTKSSDDVCDTESSQKPNGRMSRRDMQNAAATAGRHIRKRGIIDGGTGNTSKDGNDERKITAFHDTYSKRTAEKKILGKKGLRLPNTSKHLAAREHQSSLRPSGVKAKLTDWNSVDKLTEGSMNDLSHLEEDPWVMNTEASNSTGTERKSVNSLTPTRHLPKSLSGTNSRPRGHSDLTEMMHVANNKENLDWLVYLNRNSFISSSDQSSPLPSKRMSTSVLEREFTRKENVEPKRRISAQVPYATPPRSYMTTENMKMLGSKKREDRSPSPYHDLTSRASTRTDCAVVTVNAFGVPPLTITMTKPVSFHMTNLSRSNSSPIASKGIMAAKVASKGRPVSMDIDQLTDESNRMVAEMEEYISKTPSSESVKSINKFPTSLPTITVEEDETDGNSNRLSVVSSVSTSSYESQGSSSSDGLVGTLKHKLNMWGHFRNDSEHSYASTLSDDDDKDDTCPTKSSNTFEPSPKNKSTWKEDRELESVLREHSLGSSVIGSRMAHAIPTSKDSIKHQHCSDASSHESRPHSTGSFSKKDDTQETSENIPLMKENPPDQARFSLPPTTEATQALMPSSLKNCEIQQSDSGFSLQSTDSSMSDHTQVPDENETATELSEGSSKEVTPTTKPKLDKTKSPTGITNLERQGSCESVNSSDSFYERRLSVAFESEVFLENPKVVNVYEDPSPQRKVEAQEPRKSIREYVQNLEERFRPQSPKVFEVKRREPGAMIRQRLETLRESVIHGTSSSRDSSRQASEEREFARSKSQPPSQHRNKLSFAKKIDKQCNDDIKVNAMSGMKISYSNDSLSKTRETLSRSRDTLSKSKEMLSKSRDSLSKSRDSLNFNPDSPNYKFSSPTFTNSPKHSGHESHAIRFTYKTSDQSEAHFGNQFIHRARSNSDQPVSEVERSPSPVTESGTLSKSMCRLDQMSSEVDNLVIMKGWVRALISKFQDKP